MEGALRKTALVTGAAKRIGRATALALADAGMNVVVHYRRSKAEALEVCAAIEERGVRAFPVAADFDEEGASIRLFDEVIARAGRVDVLVNNASGFPEDDLRTLSFDRLVRTARVNAWAPFELGRAFAERAGEGVIVNLLDSRIVSTDRNHSGYLLSKALLTALTRMCAIEWAPTIRVNGVAPGLILPPPGVTHDYLEARVGTVPLAQHGMPEQIARAVVFLAETDFITGEVVFVDGGRHLAEYQPAPHG